MYALTFCHGIHAAVAHGSRDFNLQNRTKYTEQSQLLSICKVQGSSRLFTMSVLVDEARDQLVIDFQKVLQFSFLLEILGTFTSIKLFRS